MGSEGTIVAAHGDSKGLDEAKTRPQLPSASQLSRSSSSGAKLDYDMNKDSSLNDSIPKSKSEGDLSHEQESISKPRPEWTTSPPAQTMVHPSGFDPNRIPSSVFSSKPANASEWSMASNDSLFSIHMGNASFTNEEWNTSQSLYVTEAKPSELCSLPPLMEDPTNEEGSAKSSNVSTLEKEDVNESQKEASTSRVSSDRSSFAFPVLAVDDGGKGSLLKSVEEKSEVQKKDAEAAESPGTSGWFSCLWCWPRCC